MFITKHSNPRPPARTLASILLLSLAVLPSACVDEDDDEGEHDDDHEHSGAITGEDGGAGVADGGSPNDAGSAAAPRAFVLSSLVSSGDESMSYVTVLESLEGQTVDYENSREFSGNADTWVYDGAVFVVDAETQAITKYMLEGDQLEEAGKLSLLDYGPTDVGFWVNVFISPTKAYFGNPPGEYIVWNPKTMEITGTIPLPDMPDRGPLTAVFSYADRSAILRDNLLFHAVYWATEDYFSFSEDSKIMVFDTDTDELVDVLEAPCPGLDYGTKDAEDNVYFSSWIYAPGGAAVLDSPQTCVVEVPNSTELSAERAFNVADVTDGREGGALRYLAGGQGMMAVLHDEHASEDEVEVADVTFGANWRFWSYDFESGAAAVIDSIDWNAGAAYTTTVGDVTYMLVPSGSYTSTIVYEIGLDGTPKRVLEAPGWALRLFPLE
jgi:hypothetical protein